MHFIDMVLPKMGQSRMMPNSVFMSSWTVTWQLEGLYGSTVSTKSLSYFMIGGCGFRSHLFFMNRRYSGEPTGKNLTFYEWNSVCW